jgi:hypothetical protein
LRSQVPRRPRRSWLVLVVSGSSDRTLMVGELGLWKKSISQRMWTQAPSA